MMVKDLVFNKKGMAKGISFAFDQFNRSLDEIKQVVCVHSDSNPPDK
jgi:hypothetical protein